VRPWVATAALILYCVAARAGAIVGTVRDERCKALYDAFVRAIGPTGVAADGVRTNREGYYRVAPLAPGKYRVHYIKPDYDEQVFDIEVAYQATAYDVQLIPKFGVIIVTCGGIVGEAITVTATTAIPELLAVGTSTTLPPEYVGSAPTAQAIILGGVTFPETATNVPIIAIDSANVGFTQAGIAAAELSVPMDALAHVASRPAELAGTGPVSIAISTRPPTTFDGTLTLDNTPGASTANSARVALPSNADVLRSTTAVSGHVGGPIVPGRWWFFVSARGQHAITAPAPALTIQDAGLLHARTREGTARLTTAYTDNQTGGLSTLLAYRIQGGSLGNTLGAVFGAPAATGRTSAVRTANATLSHDVIVGPYVAISARIGRTDERTTTTPIADVSTPQIRDANQQLYATAGPGFFTERRRFARSTAGANIDLNRSWHGNHNVRVGGTIDQESDERHDRLSGGQLVDALGSGVFLHRFFEGDTPGMTHDRVIGNVKSFFSQDHVETASFTLNAGLRWDQEYALNQDTRVRPRGVLQPRLSVTWAVPRVQRLRILGAFSRYAETLDPLQRAALVGSQRFSAIANRDSLQPARTPEVIASGPLGTYGGVARVDPHVQSSASDELTLGMSSELSPNTFWTVTATQRRLRRLLADVVCTTARSYCITNVNDRTLLYDVTLISTGLAPRPERRYSLVRSQLSYRTADRSATVVYAWSRLTGNFDPAEYTTTNTIGIDVSHDPSFDYLGFAMMGPLPQDRRHALRFDASLRNRRLRYAIDGYWTSGEPLSRYAYSDMYGRYVSLLSPRGAEGRSPSIYELNARAEYTLRIADADVATGLSVQNALNAQRPLTLDQRWSFRELDNRQSLPSNPTYLIPLRRAAPRRFMLTARVTF
jgi:hypothetical protein